MLCGIGSPYHSLLVIVGLCWCWSWANDAVLYLFTLPFFEGHHLSWLHREKCHQRTSGGILAASCRFCGLRPIGRASRFLLDQTADSRTVFVNGSSYCCWFLWTELLIILTMKTGITPTALFLIRSTSSFALLTFPFHYLWWVVA